MPEDVPGYGHLAERRARFRALLDSIAFNKDGAVDRAQGGKGRILRGDVLAMLPGLPVVREAIADTGVGFIRRANPDGHDYFFANLTAAAIETVGDARDRRDFGNSPRSTHRERRPRRIATYRQSDRDLSPARPGRVARAADTP